MHLSLLVERFVPTKVIRVRNKDKPWFNDDCRLAFVTKQGAHLRWTRDRSRDNWDEFVHYKRRANAVYAEAMRQFSVRSRDVLMNAQCSSDLEVSCVQLKFRFVSSSSYWGGWWSGLRVGREGRYAVGPF